MINIKEVAERAGVSTSTVSRVLSGKSYASEKSRQTVLAAVRELDYKPNVLAKSLKMGRTNTIALIVPSIENDIFPIIARGVEDTARKNGFTVILCNTDDDLAVEIDYINKIRTRWVDGLIVCTMQEGSSHIGELHKEGFPIVLVERVVNTTIDAVVIDNYQAAYNAVAYLIRTGHTRIMLALGNTNLNIYAKRLDGYKAALHDYQIPFDEDLIVREGDTTSSFYYLTHNLLDRGVQFDAVFATTDAKAIVVIRALKDRGFRIPEDISVMGFDNVEISSMMDPPLSTVSQPLYEIGALAARKLFRLIKTKHPAPPVVDVMGTDLIIRKSTR